MALTATTSLLVDLIIDSVCTTKIMPSMQEIFAVVGTSTDLTDAEAAIVAAIFMYAKSGQDIPSGEQLAAVLNMQHRDYLSARASAFAKIEKRVREGIRLPHA